MNWKQTAIAAATVLSIAGVTAYAQQTSQTTGPSMMGPGMMGGQGSGGYGPGSGMGHGMMHGDGDRDAMGPGMMGGMGGMGMMGSPGALRQLDLNDTQRKQVVKIEDELRRKNWDVMGRMQDEMAKLRDAMWAGDKRDRAGILAANKRMSELRQQMLENSLDAADKSEAVLTPQQREQLRRLDR